MEASGTMWEATVPVKLADPHHSPIKAWHTTEETLKGVIALFKETYDQLLLPRLMVTSEAA
jgi:hypothetical protein